MSNKILVTDSLFIFDEHIAKLEAAGYEVERLDNPKATEAELIAAVKGKVGYVIGGIEKVTEPVLAAADSLKAIVFTGTAYKFFIPSWEKATEQGIAIANAPHANAQAVAEWLFATGVSMLRNLYALGRTGDKTFQTTHSLSEQQVGIIGLGHVGAYAGAMFEGVGAKKVVFWNRSDKLTNFEKLELDELLKTSDIICVSVGHGAGKLLDSSRLGLVKDGAIITAIEHAIDEDALLTELQSGRIKACLEWTPKNEAFKKLPLDVFYCSNETTAYNTFSANQLASDWATDSMINLLTSGNDKYRVN